MAHKTHGLEQDYLHNMPFVDGMYLTNLASDGWNGGYQGVDTGSGEAPTKTASNTLLQKPSTPTGRPLGVGPTPAPAPIQPSTGAAPAGMLNVGEWFTKEGWDAQWSGDTVIINGVPISTADMQLVNSTYYATPEVLQKISQAIPVGQFSGTPGVGGPYVPPSTGVTPVTNTDKKTETELVNTEKETVVVKNNAGEEVTTESIVDQLLAWINMDRGEMPILSWEQALEQSRSQLDPLYADKEKDLRYSTDVDLSRRGIFRSGLGGKITTDKVGDLQNEQVAAIATLAQTLVDSSRDASLADRGLDIEEMGAGGGLLSNLMNSLITQEGNNMSYDLGKEANAIDQQQANSDSAYKQWAMDNEGTASEWEKFQMAYNVWQDTGVAPDSDVLSALGVSAGTGLTGAMSGDMSWAQEYASGVDAWEKTGIAPDSTVLKYFGIQPGAAWETGAAEQAKAIELKILNRDYDEYLSGDATQQIFSGLISSPGFSVSPYYDKSGGEPLKIDITEAAIFALVKYGSVAEASSRITQNWNQVAAQADNNFDVVEKENRPNHSGNQQRAAVVAEIERLNGLIDINGYNKAFLTSELSGSGVAVEVSEFMGD